MATFPHTLPIDNGNYHGGVGDFHLAVRYQLREHPLTITPFIAVSFPTVPYQHFAHSAIGSDMWEVGLGFSAGRRLDPWLPHAYLQTRYTFVITQRETIRSYNLRVRPNHSRMDAELGYFLAGWRLFLVKPPRCHKSDGQGLPCSCRYAAGRHFQG